MHLLLHVVLHWLLQDLDLGEGFVEAESRCHRFIVFDSRYLHLNFLMFHLDSENGIPIPLPNVEARQVMIEAHQKQQQGTYVGTSTAF